MIRHFNRFRKKMGKDLTAPRISRAEETARRNKGIELLSQLNSHSYTPDVIDYCHELIEGGADLTVTSGKNLQTALHLAIRHKLDGLIPVLVDAGADTQAGDINHHTPNDYALQSGMVDELKKSCDNKVRQIFLQASKQGTPKRRKIHRRNIASPTPPPPSSRSTSA
ncbi:MAG: ankyrin repeat domain-containing protein [Alphaproteobacteria bacterium]|nr:ankyrin repeat domain-containing protein [Alphaproteobacteria bacterium]